MIAAQRRLPTPRALGRALGVVLALPPPALWAVAGLLIDHLDAAAVDPDLDADEDSWDARSALPGP